MPYVLNGEPIPHGAEVIIDGIGYSMETLSIMGEDGRASLGVTWVEPEPVVLTLEEEREAFFIRVGDYRREASQRLTFAGMSIFLDAKTEDAIHKGIKGLERSPPGTTIKFEIKPGYVAAMDLIWMEALGDAAFALVQACFAHSALLCEQGWAAETVEDLRAIDIVTGWPE